MSCLLVCQLVLRTRGNGYLVDVVHNSAGTPTVELVVGSGPLIILVGDFLYDIHPYYQDDTRWNFFGCNCLSFHYGFKWVTDIPWYTPLFRDVRILCQKIANSACMICKFCTPFLQILRKFCAAFQPVFSMVKLSDTGVLSRVSWLVGPLKLTWELLFNLHLSKFKWRHRLHLWKKINNEWYTV